jgi:hypothetical protein
VEILTKQEEAVCLLWSGAIGRGLQATTPRFVGVPDKQYPRWYELLLKVTLRLFHQSHRSGEDRLEVRDVPVKTMRSSDVLTSRGHDVLAYRGHDVLTSRGHDVLTSRGHDMLAYRGHLTCGTTSCSRSCHVSRRPLSHLASLFGCVHACMRCFCS